MTTHGTFPTRLVFRIFVLCIIGSVFTSCKTGNTLAEQGIIQKRKYQKGYYVNVKTPFESKKETVNQIDLDDRPFTASVKAEIRKDSKNDVLQHSNPASSDFAFSERESNSPLITHESTWDENAEASLTMAPAVVSKSVFAGFKPINQSATPANTFSPDPEYYSAKRLNTLALLSFIFGVLSFFILGLPLGTAAVVLGIIGLVQIESNPTIYKGKGFAIIGLIIGLIAVIIMIGYLSSQ